MLVHSEAARKEGFGITLHLDSQTRTTIDEFSTSGFLGLRKDAVTGKTTMVVPDSRSVIDSVTSLSCQEIAEAWGWGVEKRTVGFENSVCAAEGWAGLMGVGAV